MVHSLTLEDGDQITIAQQSNSSTKKVLTRTEPMMYEEPKNGIYTDADAEPGQHENR